MTTICWILNSLSPKLRTFDEYNYKINLDSISNAGGGGFGVKENNEMGSNEQSSNIHNMNQGKKFHPNNNLFCQCENILLRQKVQ